MQGMKQKKQLSTSQKLQLDMDFIKKLIQELENGKNSLDIVRSLIIQKCPRVKVEDSFENTKEDVLNHHSLVALETFHNTLSMLNNCNPASDAIFVDKPKLDQLGQRLVVSPNHSCNSGVSANQHTYNMSIVDDDDNRRKCNKRRRISSVPREEEVSHLAYDGFGWRKYGQKMIHDYQHPRNYYRCTHKYDQECQATKQIQQVSNNPIKYKLIYHGNHTCNNDDNNGGNNVYKTSPYMIDSPEEHSSTIVLNFEGSNQVNPSLFPTTSYSNNLTINEDAEGTTTNATIPSPSSLPLPLPSNHVYEGWSTTASPISLEEDYYNNIVADFSQLQDYGLFDALF